MTEQLGEKGSDWGVSRSQLLQGLKPEVDLICLIGPAEAVPLLQSLRDRTFRPVSHQAVKPPQRRRSVAGDPGKSCHFNVQSLVDVSQQSRWAFKSGLTAHSCS
jgi:hypothetical protein